jgi:hypothetical protein
MYFFIVLFLLLAAIVIHIIAEYKKKAIRTGEADLSLTARNILPTSRTCKVSSLVTFIAIILTGILLAAEGGRGDWNILSISSSQWADIHLTIVILFVILFGLHVYIHWKWIKHIFSSTKQTV